jgi:sortase A
VGKNRRRLRRAFANALIAVGVLLVAEMAVTLLWREPVTALSVAGSQGELSRQLDQAEAKAARAMRSSRSKRVDERPPSMARLAMRFARGLEVGSPIGSLRIPAIGLDQVVALGVTPSNLKRGPAHYEHTLLPGQHGTVAIAGHRTTYGAPFRNLDDLDPGDRIQLKMPYGTFRYRVAQTRIVEPDAVGVLKSFRYPRLVLTACHPIYSNAQRLVVVANLVRAAPS